MSSSGDQEISVVCEYDEMIKSVVGEALARVTDIGRVTCSGCIVVAHRGGTERRS